MIRIFLFISIAFLYSRCADIGQQKRTNSYEIVEHLIIDGCSIYSMKFAPGNDILFKLSTSGNCYSISSVLILESYQTLLKEYDYSNRDIDLTRKTILLEFPSEIGVQTSEIRELTERILRKNIYLERDKNQDFEKIKIEIH